MSFTASKGFIIAALLGALAGVVIGMIATRWMLDRTPPGVMQSFGPWSGSPLIGSEDGSAYLRALISHSGLLALSRDEAIYFFARQDSALRPLRAECRYRIEVASPPARWWSITLYGEDYFLVPHDGHYYSVSGADEAPGTSRIFTIGKVDEPAADALPGPERGRMVLTFRLYQPEVDPEHWDRIPMPSVEREACA